MQQLPALIGGESVATAAEVPVEDPSTGEVMAVTADCGPAEIDQAVRAAAEAARSWRRVSVPERARLLRRLSALIDRDTAELGRLESQQTGKPLRQGLRDAEITVRYFDFTPAQSRRSMARPLRWMSAPRCARCMSRTGSPPT